MFFFEQKLIKMNLHSNVAESVIVLRSKTKRTKKLLYLIGFEDEFVSNILNENEEVSYEIIQKHQLKEVSIQSLIELNLSNAPEFALICDLNILRKNNYQFLSRVRKETTLQSVPFIVINRTSDSIDLKTAIKKGIDDCYELPLKWENILSRIEFLIQHKAKVQKIGNNLGMPEPALKDTLEDLEDEIKDETGVDVKLPLDVKDSEVLMVTPSADFFAEPHIDGLIGYAKVFHESGVTWTLSSYASEAANFGMFIGNYDVMRQGALRIRKAAIDLNVRRVIVGECGHAWRVAYSFWNTLTGIGSGGSDEYSLRLQKQLDSNYPQPQHMIEFTYDLIQNNQLSFDKSKNDHRIVTFHDSCNVARGSNMGDIKNGQFILPREVIKAACDNFVEMPKNTIKSSTFCCGGGGGLLTDDLIDLRIKGAKPRMHALKKTEQESGVNTLAAICAICKSQFSKVLPNYDFDPYMIVSVHQLVSDAIVLKESSDNEV